METSVYLNTQVLDYNISDTRIPTDCASQDMVIAKASVRAHVPQNTQLLHFIFPTPNLFFSSKNGAITDFVKTTDCEGKNESPFSVIFFKKII